MKGIISNDLDLQSQRPRGPGFFEKGTEVNIRTADYDDNVLWYTLDNGIKVKALEVELGLYSNLLPDDLNQFYICYRKLDENNAPIADKMSDAPDTLYFSLLSSPEIRVTDWSPQIFANAVSQSVSEMDRKHVFVYMHGFDWEPGLKLDLAAKFVQSFANHSENSIAKVLYFGWPSFGGRNVADDRAIAHGQHFTQKGLFVYLDRLAEALRAQEKTLNLIVHSFGHQLLNGMINPGEGNTQPIPEGIFENIFLMAPDITHLAIQKNGVRLRNPKPGSGNHYYYNYAPLKKLGRKVHIYHNSADYLLYMGTKKSNGNNDNGNFDTNPNLDGITTDYRTLGNFGKDIFDEPGSTLNLEPGFNFIDVQKLISDADDSPVNCLYYPFRNNTDAAIAKAKNGNYSGITLFDSFWDRDLLMPHHQYLFTCKPVVDDILKQLNTVESDTQPLNEEAPIV